MEEQCHARIWLHTEKHNDRHSIAIATMRLASASSLKLEVIAFRGAS